MSTFTNALIREIGRNYGKAISNSLLGDAHANPVRIVGTPRILGAGSGGRNYENKLIKLLETYEIKGATATFNVAQNMVNYYMDLVEEAQADNTISLSETSYLIKMFSKCHKELGRIHTALEDYKLAYLLNKNLNTHFSKSQKNLEFESNKKRASFSIYNFSSKKYDFDWFLIANSFKRENQTESNELLLTTETKTYLIPEKKKVDFFIKISGEISFEFLANAVNKIKNIEQIITSYSIDKNTLKSKDFLIF